MMVDVIPYLKTCCLVILKGAAIDRILGEIIHNNDVRSPIDYVLCVGHFLPKVYISL